MYIVKSSNICVIGILEGKENKAEQYLKRKKNRVFQNLYKSKTN